ncbi:hypothetical protein [uncultured Microbacterium sp.]|uniref:hypothetical protein n=1 Tax=uncultured Microbacterium sp. TaxID=191216 RepID=UPI0025DFD582|nr:hypothetical protein [uncultured Microbacterium sp.]
MSEQQHETDEVGVIDSLRAPARNLHETWRSDLTKTAGQLMAEEGIDRKEAQNRVLWARRQQKREDKAFAFAEALAAKHAARRRPEPGRTPSLQTETSSTNNNDQEVTQ